MLAFCVLLLLIQNVYSQTFCSSDKTFCVYSEDKGSNAQFTLSVQSSRIKWAAIGFGGSMRKAEVYMAWKEASGFTVSRRASTGHQTPIIVQNQCQTLVNNASLTADLGNGNWIVTFLRPKAAIDAQGVQVDITSDSQPMIWAYGARISGTGINAQPSIHTDYSSPFASLYKSASAFNSGIIPKPSTGSVSSDPNTIIIIHGILMFVAWQVFCPMAIYIAKFMKKRLGVWWFRLHWGIMLFGVAGLSVIGFYLGYSRSSSPHFDASKYSGSAGLHVIFGLLVCVLCLFQIVSGIVIDRLWNPSRKSVPWYDKVHWWTGRILYVLAFANIPLGFYLFQVIYQVQIDLMIWIGFFVFAVVVFLGFFLQKAPIEPLKADSEGELLQKMGSEQEISS